MKILKLLLGMQSWLHKVLLFFLMEQPSERQTLQNSGLAHARKLRSRGIMCRKSTTSWQRYDFLPQIREVINYDLSEDLLVETEKSAWLTFKTVCLNFLGNVKATNWKKFVEDLLNACQTMGCNSLIFNIPTWTSRFRTWLQWVTNMAKGFTRIFPPRRKVIQ
jgi:hypothetical protein